MTRAMTLAAAITWAISPAWLSTILAIANREGPGPEAVAKELGRPLDNTQTVIRRGDVAVIPVTGPIFRRANVFSQVSGATSVQVLATELNVALDAEEVSAVVLDIDSPGGEANGICELSEMLYAMRGRKPIIGYVGGTGASAAYWIASACDKLYVSETAEVGSIGVVRAVPNPKADSAKSIEIVSSQSPNKRPDVLSDDGRAVFQAEVDALADVFVAKVARNRGVSVETVLSQFGKGGCLIGARAVAAGMADAVSSFEAVIASLSTSSASEPSGPALHNVAVPMAAAPPESTMAPKMTVTVVAEDEKKNPEADNMPPASEPDGDEPKAPAFAAGDAVMVDGRPAEVASIVDEPCYVVNFTDDGGGSRCAMESELEPAAGESEDPAAEEDPKDDSPAAIRARALAAEVRKLKLQLAGKTVAEAKAAQGRKVEELVAAAKTANKATPANLPYLRTLAAAVAGNAQAFAALSAFVGASPRAVPTRVQQPARVDHASKPSLTHNGKSWAELSYHEKHNLFANDPDLASAMQAAAKSSAG